MKQYITPSFVRVLDKNEIFVFGSNLQGAHGGGAARLANQEFGAQWGVGAGPTGQCYAIPTMHGGVESINPYVQQFIDYAEKAPDKLFLVTEIGCGIAGFHYTDIAPLFHRAVGMPNVALPENFARCLGVPESDWVRKIGGRWETDIISARGKDIAEWDSGECRRNLEDALDRLKRNGDDSAYYEVRQIRRDVFFQTMKVSREGRYEDPQGNPHDLHCPDGSASSVVFYDREIPPLEPVGKKTDTAFHVVNKDCLEVSRDLCRPAVLNMASRQNPGGGVLNGSAAQEETLFRRTDLFRSLYQFSKKTGGQFGIRQRKEQYPLDRNFGGIYSPGVNVFRGSEKDGYPFLGSPYMIDVISVAGMNRPELKDADHIADYLVPSVKNKMRTILRIAAVHGHDTLVLGALGCGAFRNPPAHIARLFHEVFEEDEFKGRFKDVYFAILEDHNSHRGHNPHGNFQPFFDEFRSVK